MRDQLEAALRTTWTRETLTVYGDYLQSQGDPRGELIALDLHAQTHGLSPEVESRRKEIVIGLVGRMYMAALDATQIDFGFISHLGVSARSVERGIEHVLASPLGTYVRAASIYGEKTALKKLVTMFGRYTHPWLKRLTVGHSESYMTAATDPFISAGSTKRLVAATPVLETFVIESGGRNRPVFPPFTHPSVRQIKTVTFEARAANSPTIVHIVIDSQAPDQIELGRTTRMLIESKLSAEQRLAWLDFMIFVDGLTPGAPDHLDPKSFPTGTLQTALGAIDFGLYYGKDWAPVRDKLRPISKVAIARFQR